MEEGTVDYFHETSGYGFIESSATSEDVFFHMTEVGDTDPMEGQSVRFEYKQTNEGPRATTLELLSESTSDVATSNGGQYTSQADGRESTVTGTIRTNEGSRSTGAEDDPRQMNYPGLRIPSRDTRERVRNPEHIVTEATIEAGDLVYLHLAHNQDSLGDQHPFRDTFALLIGSGACPELEQELVGRSLDATGQIEVSTTTGDVRLPLQPKDAIDPEWLGELIEDAGVDTVQEFVGATGSRLTDIELLDAEKVTAKQADLEPLVEEWALVEYELVDAVRWREHGDAEQTTLYSSSESEWPMYGGGPARTGHVAGMDLPTETPDVVWSIDIGAEISSSPAVMNDRIVFGGAGGNVYALREGSEEILWSVDLGSDRVTSSPAIVDDTVFIASPDGDVHALEVETGESEWASATYRTGLSSPVVVGLLVVIGTGNGLIALDAASGDIRWGLETNEWMTSPAIVSDTVYAGSENGRLYAVDADTGQQQWSVSLASNLPVTSANQDDLAPSILNDRGYIQWQNSIHAVNTNTGSEQWSVDRKNPHSIVVTPESVFLASQRYLISFSNKEKDGKKPGDGRWSRPFKNRQDRFTVATDASILVADLDGKLDAYNCESGDQQWSIETAGPIQNSPALVNDRIYVPSGSTMYALE